MKSLMLLLALGLASADKLDRTYLPPPGSKIAGGSDGAIQVPLEFPKETYSTTLRPLKFGQKEDGLISAGDTHPTKGINRGTELSNIPPGLHDLVPVNPGPKTLSGYLQNQLPTTTTTYAFTQTTTFPPTEGFDTTTSPFGQTVFPSDISQDIQTGIYASSGQSQGYPLPSGSAYIQPGTQIVQQPGVLPSGTVQHPGYKVPGQTLVGLPGYLQPSINQYLPSKTPTSTVSPNRVSPPGSTQSYFDQGYNQNLGVQFPTQFSQQVPSSTPVPQGVPQAYQPSTTPSYYGNTVQGPNVPGFITSQQIGSERPQNFRQQDFQSTIQPSDQYVTDNQGNSLPISNSQELGEQLISSFGGQAGPNYPSLFNNNNLETIPRMNLPQQLGGQQPVFSGQQGQPLLKSLTVSQPDTYSQYSHIPGPNNSQPGIGQQGSYHISDFQGTSYPTSVAHYQGSINSQGGVTTDSTTSQGQQPQFINQPNFIPSPVLPQGIPVDIIPGQSSTTLQPTQGPINLNEYQITDDGFPPQHLSDRPTAQSIYRPDSTAPTSIISHGSKQPSYSGNTPGTTSGSFPSTTIYPILSGQSGNIPERPQAESNRNAEIISYKNVLTPEGEFEYSFDTSNGIHADENGTSVDGVKAEGSYSYIGDDGKLYSVVYSADENGFRPRGDHLPTPPPIPEAIQKVIEQAAKDKEAGITHDGFYDEEKYGYKKYQRPQQQVNFITNEADAPNDYDHNIRPGQVRLGQIRPGKFKLQGIKSEESHIHKIPVTDAEKDEYEDYIIENEDHLHGVQENSDGRKLGSQIPSDKSDELQHEYAFDGDRRVVSSNKKPFGSRGNINRYLPRVNESSSQPGLTKDDVYETEGEINKHGDVENNDKDMKYYGQVRQKLPGRFDQQYTVTGRPKGTQRPLTTTFRYNDEETYTELPGVQYGRRPIKPSPKSQYPESEQNGKYFEEDVSKSDIVSEKPQGSRRIGSQGSKYYQGQTRKPGKSSVFQNYTIADKGKDIYDQGAVRGPYNQEKESMRTNYPLKPSDKDSGYQYLPPQHKFEENERFPTRFSDEVTQGSTTRQPVTQEFSDKKSTVQPFMTPNVHREEDISYEDTDQGTLSRTPGQIITSPDKNESTEDFSYDERDTEVDLEIDDEHNNPIRVHPEKLGTIKSSTHRYPSQQTKSRPQYGEKYSDDKTIQQGTRPEHNGSIYPKPSGQPRTQQVTSKERVIDTKRPSYIKSSTTPMPSRGRGPIKGKTQYEQNYVANSDNSVDDYSDLSFPSSTARPGMRIPIRPKLGSDRSSIPKSTMVTPGQTDVSRPSSRPEFKFGDRTSIRGVSRVPSNRPEQRIDDHSTPKTETYTPGFSTSEPDSIYIDQSRPSFRPEMPGASRRPTTYYPSANVPESVTDQNIPGTKLPSTTYRPTYTIIGETTGRPISVDRSGTPVSTTFRPGYSATQDANISNQGPGSSGVQTTTQDFRPNEPRFGQKNLLSFGVQRPSDQVTSTTDRIIGEDFSGPKQPQRFDPETGYHY